MSKTTKTAIAVLSFLVFWMLSGIFFSDTKNNAEISLKINNEESLINVKAKVFSSESRLASVKIQGRTVNDICFQQGLSVWDLSSVWVWPMERPSITAQGTIRKTIAF